MHNPSDEEIAAVLAAVQAYCMTQPALAPAPRASAWANSLKRDAQRPSATRTTLVPTWAIIERLRRGGG